MSDPRGHHLVPQSYLRAFAAKRGQAWQAIVVDRATGATTTRNVRDLFKRRDYNTIVDEEGNRDLRVEEFLAAEIEDPGARVLDRIRGGTFPLDDERRDVLGLWMAAQLVRGNEWRENVSEFLVNTNRTLLRMAAAHYPDERLREITGADDVEQVRRVLADHDKHVEIKPTTAMLLQATLSPIAEIAEVLERRAWTLVRLDEPCLVTSENPVVMINPSGQSGWGAATAERLYLPLDPSSGLVLSHPWAGWPEATICGGVELARRLNWSQISYPINAEIVLHPDTGAHPLPGAAILAGGGRWPWPPDPDCEPPIFLRYLN